SIYSITPLDHFQFLYVMSYLFLLHFLIFLLYLISFFFFFNDTATTEIYTLSLHDALPISLPCSNSTPWNEPTSSSARSPAGLDARPSGRTSHPRRAAARWCWSRRRFPSRSRPRPWLRRAASTQSRCHSCRTRSSPVPPAPPSGCGSRACACCGLPYSRPVTGGA